MARPGTDITSQDWLVIHSLQRPRKYEKGAVTYLYLPGQIHLVLFSKGVRVPGIKR